MYVFYDFPFSSPATPPAPVRPAVGSIGRRRIPVERLREILEAQQSPWAKELKDTYQQAEKSIAVSKGRRQEVIDEVLDVVCERIAAPVDWGPVLASVRAATDATRATLAIKHAETALRALRAAYEDEDEDVTILMQWFFNG